MLLRFLLRFLYSAISRRTQTPLSVAELDLSGKQAFSHTISVWLLSDSVRVLAAVWLLSDSVRVLAAV